MNATFKYFFHKDDFLIVSGLLELFELYLGCWSPALNCIWADGALSRQEKGQGENEEIIFFSSSSLR
jgi:hypothetical protein